MDIVQVERASLIIFLFVSGQIVADSSVQNNNVETWGRKFVRKNVRSSSKN
jgi:hypothetical protein